MPCGYTNETLTNIYILASFISIVRASLWAKFLHSSLSMVGQGKIKFATSAVFWSWMQNIPLNRKINVNYNIFSITIVKLVSYVPLLLISVQTCTVHCVNYIFDPHPCMTSCSWAIGWYWRVFLQQLCKSLRLCKQRSSLIFLKVRWSRPNITPFHFFPSPRLILGLSVFLIVLPRHALARDKKKWWKLT